MKLFLFNGEGYFLEEVEADPSMEYTNATDIAPNFKDYNQDIYNFKFNRFTNSWEYEYSPEFLEKKAKELNLEICQISTMSEADLRSGKLPQLDTIQNQTKKLKRSKK